MKQFFRQVDIDLENMRFCAVCGVCKTKQHADKLPALCRNRELIGLLKKGEVGGVRQARFNAAQAAAVQKLSRWFNLCPSCGVWVCDECFDMSCGSCRICAVKPNNG